MPRINNPVDNRIARTSGIRQQRQNSLSYPNWTGRFLRPSYYRNMPILVLIVRTLNQIDPHMSNARKQIPIVKTPSPIIPLVQIDSNGKVVS